jgi:magnesium transporter
MHEPHELADKAGFPPGSLCDAGVVTEPTHISLIAYDEATVSEHDDLTVNEALELEDPSCVNWFNISGLNHPEAIEAIGKRFNLHPLTLEDILSTRQRPKVEFFGNYLYIVLRMLSFDAKEHEVHDEQVSLILGPDYLLSFQERSSGDVFEPLRERIRQAKGKARKMGADYLAYALMDIIVDNYFVILEGFGEVLDELETELVGKPDPATIREINRVRRQMLFLRKSVWPLREVLSVCQREEDSLFTPDVLTYLRDVYDHTIQVVDTIETFRDLLTGMLDLYMSNMSYRMNEIMKGLTIAATIFLPLTFLASIYGMNFTHMPELKLPWGYPAVLGLMALIALGLIAYFKYKKWL